MRFEKGEVYKWRRKRQYFILLHGGERANCLPIISGDKYLDYTVRYNKTTQFEYITKGDVDKVYEHREESSNPYWQEGQVVSLAPEHEFVLYQWVNNWMWRTESGLYIRDCHLFKLKDEREDRQLYNILRA